MIIKEDKNDILIEQSFFADEFLWTINTHETIQITQEDEIYVYLKELMNNEYIFQNNNLSYKTKDKIVYLSDQYCDFEDKYQTDRINRLVIEKKENIFLIHVENPFLEKIGIKRDSYIISFSPSGNGYYTKNIKTNNSFQDDIINIYISMKNNKIKILK